MSNPAESAIPRSHTPDLVSVITPVYNRAHCITSTLQSVADQTYPQIEHLVIDDGSTDDTCQIVQQFAQKQADGRLRLLRQENSGPSKARNLGLIQSRGQFIQFLDSDDLLDPDKIALQVAALRTDPELDFVYGPSKLIDNGEDAGDNLHWLSSESSLLGYLDGSCWWHIEGPLFRRLALLKVGLFREDIHGEDSEYNARALALGLRGTLVAHAWTRHAIASPDSYGICHCRLADHEAFIRGRLLLRELFDKIGNVTSREYDALARTMSGVAWSLAKDGHVAEAMNVMRQQSAIARSTKLGMQLLLYRILLRFLGSRLTLILWKKFRGW